MGCCGGVRCPAVAAPSGVVTFLFTDVEGSTRRWEADAEAMRVALAAHDEVLRAAIEAHGGWLFKHTGDGVCAAFASPRSGVDAAVAAQRALELPVRMGLATGEAELRGGRLFRCGVESCCAGDGCRARWSDPGGRFDGGSARRGRAPGSGAAAVAGLVDPGRGFPGPGRGTATDIPATAGLDATPGNLRPQNRASSGAGRRRRGGSGAAGTSVGDVDRGGRGRQDPAGAGSWRRGWPMNSRTGSGFSNWPGSAIRVRCPMRWPRCWASPNSPAGA